MASVRSLFSDTVGGVIFVGWRSIAAVETVIVAALVHDEFGRIEDS